MNKDLKVGDRIKDNDPRVGDRVLRIVSFSTEAAGGVTHAYAQPLHTTYKTPIRIRLDRIHGDSKPRKSGFSLVREPAGAQ